METFGVLGSATAVYAVLVVTLIALIVGFVVFHPAHETSPFLGKKDFDPLEVSRLKNQIRQTNAAIIGGLVVALGLGFQFWEQRRLDSLAADERYNDAVRSLESSQESSRVAGLREIEKSIDYLPQRSDAAKDTVHAFVTRNLLDDEQRRTDAVRAYVDGVIPKMKDKAQPIYRVTRKLWLIRLKRTFFDGGSRV